MGVHFFLGILSITTMGYELDFGDKKEDEKVSEAKAFLLQQAQETAKNISDLRGLPTEEQYKNMDL